MTGVDVRTVRALVAARVREQSQWWPIFVLGLLAATAIGAMPYLIFPATHAAIAMFHGLYAAFFGGYVGLVANAPLRASRWTGNAMHAGGLEASRVLPVTAFARLIASIFIAATLTSPFAMIIVGWAVHKQRSPTGVAIELGSVVLGYVLCRIWSRLYGVRFRAMFALPAAWLSRLHPLRNTEVGAAFWAMLPRQIQLTLTMLLIASVLGYGLHFVRFSDGAFSNQLGRMFVILGALGTQTSALAQVIKPLATLAVSRRAVVLAEFCFTPLLVGLTMPCAVALGVGVARDALLVGYATHLAFALSGLGAALRVCFARFLTPSTKWGVLVVSLLSGLGTWFLTRPNPPLLLDAIAVVALLVASLIAHTAPNTPLSRKPGGLASVVVRKMGAR